MCWLCVVYSNFFFVFYLRFCLMNLVKEGLFIVKIKVIFFIYKKIIDNLVNLLKFWVIVCYWCEVLENEYKLVFFLIG